MSLRRQIIARTCIAINIVSLIRLIVLIVKEDEKKWMALGDTSYLLMKLNVPQAIYVVLTLVSIQVE